MARLYLGMLNTRLDEISQKPDAPFLGAGASKGSFIGRTTDAFTLGANVKDGGIDRGLEALLVEAKRVDQFGFLQSELDRQKESLVRGYERAYAERDKTQSAALVGEYVNNYLNGEAIPGIEYEYKLVQQLVPTITLADVNKLGSAWITDTNRVIIAQSPEKDGVKIPTRDELLAVFERAGEGAGHGVHRESVDRSARADAADAGHGRERPSDPGGQRHRVDAVERRARAREADGLQGGRSAVQRVQPSAERRSRRTPISCRRAWRRTSWA